MNYEQIRTSLKKSRLALDKLELLEPLLEQHGVSDDGTISEALSDFTLSLHHLIKAVPEKLLPPMLQNGNAVHAKVEQVSTPADLGKALAQTESRLQSFIEETMREEIEKAMRKLSAAPIHSAADAFTSETSDAVRRSEARLRTIIDSTPLGICITNEDGIFEYVNDAYCRIYGYAPEELIGSHFTKIVNPDKVQFWRDLHDKYMRMTGEEIRGYSDIRTEWIVRHKDGKPITILADAARITREDGKHQKVTFVMNISEMAKLRENLRQSEMQLMQAEKMSSLGQMVAGVAHEVNTPLGYVKSNLQLLLDAQKELKSLLALHQKLKEQILHGSSNAVAKLLGDIERQSETATLHAEVEKMCLNSLDGIERIQDLVSSLKNFSRLDEAAFKQTDVNENIESTLKIAAHLFREKGIKIEKDFGTLPEIPAYPAQLNQVFLNLLTNAVQAITHERGKIKISTRQDGANAVVKISDNGTGIQPEHLSKIFEPFFTTKEIGKGTGLGLSIVYKIIEKHGGKISVESTVGKGSTFTVTLPIERIDFAQPSEGEKTETLASPFSDDEPPKPKSVAKKRGK
ncbi:MAG: ATP-binding protein [Chloroherpetonaceae bacterium]